MHDLVVVGSGPGGSSAAIAAARRGSRVLIIERGGEVGGPPGKRTLGQLLNAVKHIDNLAPRVAGGGSAINYGVVATPTANDIANAVGGVASQGVLSRFHDYLRDVGVPQAVEPKVSPIHRQFANAMQSAWQLSEATDQALDAQPPRAPRATNEEKLLYASTAQPLQGFRRDQLSIALAHPHVELWTESDVALVEADGAEGWVLHVVARHGGGGRVRVEARRVVLACGALETPRLILASAQAGGLPRGVSPHVGRHLVDHGRNEVLYTVNPGFMASMYSTLPVLISHEEVHVEAIHYSGVEACAISTANCFARCSTVRTSTVIGCLPPFCVFDDTLSTQTFDACCCAPCGVAGTFNPFRCVADRMLFVVGRRMSVEGSVAVDTSGRRITTLPRYSSEDARAVREAILDLKTAIDARVPALAASSESARFRASETDTQWHFGGTARVNVHDDGAIDASFRLLDAQGVPYATLFVGDNSATRTLPTFNTQTMAALVGYCSGAVAGEAMRRA